jgi:hypothetical protein
MMMKMQPVPPQDRPKLIAVTIGIGAALTFVARNLAGSPILAQSGGRQAAAGSASPAVPASSLPPPTGLAAADGLPDQKLGEPPSPALGFGAVEGLPLTDPFHPLPETKTPAALVQGAPAPVQAVAPSRSGRPVAAAPALPSVPVLPSAPAPASVRDRKNAESRPQPAAAQVSRPAAEPLAPTVLVGTVGQDRSGVVILRSEGKSVIARTGETVAGWQITSIRMGQIRVARAATHRTVRVGETLPGDDQPAVPPKAPGA